MPNFWTNTTQFLYETFKGPRTKDIEFELKYEQIKGFEKHSVHLKNLFLNFQKNTIGMKNYFKDVVTFIPPLYENSSPYTPHVLEIIKYHVEIEEYFQRMSTGIVSIGTAMSDWNKSYEDIDNLYKQRENIRKIYDHYDDKFEKLIKSREEKASKSVFETTAEVARFERNEEKYRTAAKDYISISIFTYNKMNEFLDLTYSLLNPMLIKLLEEERRFFLFCSETLKKYENLNSRFESISKCYQRPPENYNPLKYIRGSKLIDENFFISNFPELDYSKNLHEWKEKAKIGVKKVPTYEEYLKKVKEQNQNPEATKDKNNSNVIGSNKNINSNSSKQVSKVAPSNAQRFSYEGYKHNKGLDAKSNSAINMPANYIPDPNLNKNNAKIDFDFNCFNNIEHKFSFSQNVDQPPNYSNGNAPPVTMNPYENITLDYVNFDNSYNQAGYGDQNYNPNYGFGGHNVNNTFPINSNYINPPHNNLKNENNNFNNNYNNKNNNDFSGKANANFFDLNQLKFPK